MRRDEAQSIHRNAKRIRNRTVRFGGWLEAPHGVYGEGPLEERGQSGIRELLLHRRRGGIRQRDQSESGVTHRLKTVSHIGMCRKGQHALENPSTIGRRERDPASRRRHVKCRTTDARKVTVRAGQCDGHIVAANLLHGSQQQRTADYSVVPSVVFTIPPLAATGLLEGDARHRGLAFDVHQGNTSSWHSSRRVGETHSGFKVLVEKTSGRILGAHLLGPRADDAINLFAMAMRTGATASTLKQTLYAYPTAGSELPYML